MATKRITAKLLLEISCWLAGVSSLASTSLSAVKAEINLRKVAALMEPAKQAGSPDTWSANAGGMRLGSLVGRMDIPELHLSVPVLEGDDQANLQHAVGHIPDTAFPGGLGNVGIAGHRDTFLRPLQNLKPRMLVRMGTRAGTYSYRVDSIEVVQPAKVDVLDVGEVPQLTIVTCFPFHFIGPAPQRFIVHAHLVSLTPDT